MSGLAGVFALDGAPARKTSVDAMLDRLAHRGPDGRATVGSDSVGLGYAHFATVPGAAERPVRDAASDRWAVVDARLDNRDELARALGVRPEASDAELVLAAYDRWGIDCPARLLGDFAFVVWDAAAKRLFGARDHLGVRPLFYQHDARGFRFASEPEALFADPDVPRRLHEPSVALFLSEDYLQRDQTLYDSIFAVPPAHSFTVEGGGLTIRPYWRPDPWRETRHDSDEDYAAHYRHVLREAVRCRLRAVGKLAAEVSGGMDSSSIVAETELLRRSGAGRDEPAILVHLSYPGHECDESRFAEAVARHWDLPLLKVLPPDDPDETRPDPTRLSPGLLLYAHPLEATWRRQLDTLRQLGVRVSLTGFGSDELMLRTRRECAEALMRADLRGAAAAVGLDEAPLSPTAWRQLAREGLRQLVPGRARRLLRRMRGREVSTIPQWLTPKAQRIAADVRAQRQRDLDALSAPGPASREICWDLTHGIAFVFATAVQDPTAARGGIELRHPFYDVRLVELLLSLPHAQRCGAGPRKPLLRRAMKGDLPDVVQARPHSASYNGWIEHVLLEQHPETLERLLSNSRLEALGIIDAARVRTLLQESRRDWSLIRHVANLCCLEVWLRYSFP